MTLTIGQAAEASGISRKMIRHYESIGLFPPARRTASGYRHYSENDLQLLQFIRRARDIGFSLERIRQLILFRQDEHRQSADVKALALQYISELDDNIQHMLAMRDQLQAWVDCCHGDERAECAIIEQLGPAQS